MKKTAEFVSPLHPDKICDYIADSLLDAYIKEDPHSRCAIEITGGHNLIVVQGEVSSSSIVDIEKIVKNIAGPGYRVISNIVPQSSEIAQGVDTGGAGDQGIMCGYATDETPELLPREYVLARNLCQKIFESYPYDGKTQVTIYNDDIQTVVVSFQNAPTAELEPLVKKLIKAKEYIINPAGEWSCGGFDADTGLSGRKLVIDNYGPHISIGGGSFSGKDYTKVDRSGAYMARRIACELLKKHNAREVRTYLAYAIGKKDPVMATAHIDGKEIIVKGYDLSPQGIYEYLNLDSVSYASTSSWGHFGRDFPWDQS